MAIQKSVTRKAQKKKKPGSKRKKPGPPPSSIQKHKKKIVNALIEKAEGGDTPATNLLVKHGGLTLSEPGSAQPESDLAGLLLEQLRIEQQNSKDEPVAADAPALK